VFWIWIFRILEYLHIHNEIILGIRPKIKHKIHVCFIYLMHSMKVILHIILVILCMKQSFVVRNFVKKSFGAFCFVF
jgi:hypothetical protein